MSPRSGRDENGTNAGMLSESSGPGAGSPLVDAPPRGALAPHRWGLAQVPPTSESCICGFNKLWTLWPGFLPEILGTQRTFAFKPPQNTGVLKEIFRTAAHFPFKFFILCNPRCRLVSSEFVPEFIAMALPGAFLAG